MTNNELPEIDIAYANNHEVTSGKQQIGLRYFGQAVIINLFLDNETGYRAEVEKYSDEWSEDEISDFSRWLLDLENLQKLDEEINDTDLRAPGTVHSEYKQTVRTNYFAVKSFQAFKDDLEEVCRQHLRGAAFRIVLKEKLGVETCAVLFFTDEPWPFDEVEFWSEFFIRHLQDDWAAIIKIVGAAGYEELHASATAFNNKGETETIDMMDIEHLAKRLGNQVTEARF